MRVLPLYEGRPLAAVERAKPLDVNRGCRLCSLATRGAPKTVCIAPEGAPGGLLVVGESPGRNEDQGGRPFVGTTGVFVRGLIARHWSGPVAFDHAVRCFPGRESRPGEEEVSSCRGYLAATIREVKPQKILALGAVAMASLLGKAAAPISVRRGVGWLYSPPTPVFTLMHPASGMRNRFVRGWIEEDVAWALQAAPEPPPWDAVSYVVESPAEARQASRELLAADLVSWDVESAGAMFNPGFEVLVLSFFAPGSDHVWTFEREALAQPEVAREVLSVLEDPRVAKVGQNEKFDRLAVLCALRARVTKARLDTMQARRLLEPEAEAKLRVSAFLVGMGGLKDEARDALKAATDEVRRLNRLGKEPDRKRDQLSLLGEEVEKDPPVGLNPTLLETLKRTPAKQLEEQQFAYAFLPRKVLLRYNALDTLATGLLAGNLSERLQEIPELARIYSKVVRGACYAVSRMEEWGIGADRRAISTFSRYLAGEQEEVKARFAVYGSDFNPKSNPQIADLLFKKLGLPFLKGKPKDCVDKDVLASLAGHHPVIADLSRWRHLATMMDRYAALERFIRADGRFHPNYKIGGTRTGRMSCSDPNLHNIPRAKKSAEGRMVKDCFVARPGWVFIELDYSQLELRIAALLSKDPEMIRIFDLGQDFHQRTAELVSKLAWGIEPGQVEDKHRSEAKAFNFGLLYGEGDAALAKSIGCSVAQAARLRGAILGRLRDLDRFIKRCLAESKRDGYAWTWWEGERARRRPLFKLGSEDSEERSRAEHGSWNTPIQGTASEYCLRSLVEVVRLIEAGLPAELVLSVHDSIVLECRERDVELVAGAGQEAMLRWDSGPVKLVADMKVGPSLGSLEKLVLPGSARVEA